VAAVGRCYDGHWVLYLLDRRMRVVRHTMYSPALCMPSSLCGQCDTSQRDHGGAMLSSPCAVDQVDTGCCRHGWCICVYQGGCE
jgi:hypothetical protein